MNTIYNFVLFYFEADIFLTEMAYRTFRRVEGTLNMCIQKYLLNIIKVSKLELTPDVIETYVIDHYYAYTREQENNYLLIVIFFSAFITKIK